LHNLTDPVVHVVLSWEAAWEEEENAMDHGRFLIGENSRPERRQHWSMT
jgi:hypothetical protein